MLQIAKTGMKRADHVVARRHIASPPATSLRTGPLRAIPQLRASAFAKAPVHSSGPTPALIYAAGAIAL
jgi:hypothetical protein